MAVLESVGTADAPHRLRQPDAAAHAGRLLADAGPLLRVFEHARIEERRLVQPVEWYFEPHGFRERSRAYVDAGLPMAEHAVRSALEAAGRTTEDVDGVLFVSTTGLATPSLDSRLAERLDLAPDALRLPVWGLGCAGGVAGLARAAELADATGRRIAVVALETCSLAFPGELMGAGSGGVDKKNLVAASLFGDGCGAAIVAPGTDGLRVAASASHRYADTERVMGWDVLDERFEVVLSPGIPDLVRDSMGALTERFLDEHLGGRPDHWILHPGGAKVVDALRDALGLHGDELRHTAEVLRRHGNMSSPTVLYALGAAWDTIQAGDTALLSALGPGFAAEFLLLEKQEAAARGDAA